MNFTRTSIALTVASLAALTSAVLGSTPASAAGSALTTSITGPAASVVNGVSHFDVTVVNNGTAPTVAPWTISVDLPATNTAYQQYYSTLPPAPVVLGTLGAVSSGCALTTGPKLVCTVATPLAATPGSNAKTVGFDITLPYITRPFAFTATATDDGVVSAASTTTVSQTFRTVTAPLGQASVEYCGGTGLDGGGRRSFFECKVQPGMVMKYKVTLAANGQLTNYVYGTTSSSNGGTWSINGTKLDLVQINSSGKVLATMSLQGVSARCWEGPLGTVGTNPATNPAQYQVCL